MRLNTIALNLQLFADGGAGGEGGGASTGVEGMTTASEKGVKGNPLASVVYGTSDGSNVQNATAQNNDAQNTGRDLNAEFEKLIKGDYKQQYNDRVSNTVRQRLKATEETVKKFEAMSPMLEILSKKYGVDASDTDALSKAIEEDDSYFEDEALEKGVTVAQLKEIRKMERENAYLKKQMQEQEARENGNRLYASWMKQAQELKNYYPSFELDTEMQNPKFVDLISKNIDLRTAFEVIHKDEIMPAAMQYTAKTVEQKLANKIMAGSARPQENGISPASASLHKTDPSKLTHADINEIRRRVAAGEQIKF